MNRLRRWLGYRLLGTTPEEVKENLIGVCRSWMDAGYRLGRAHGRMEAAAFYETERREKDRDAKDPAEEAVRESWERYGR